MVLEVNQLDQKLLWAELDEDQSGVVAFDCFCRTAACLHLERGLLIAYKPLLGHRDG